MRNLPLPSYSLRPLALSQRNRSCGPIQSQALYGCCGLLTDCNKLKYLQSNFLRNDVFPAQRASFVLLLAPALYLSLERPVLLGSVVGIRFGFGEVLELLCLLDAHEHLRQGA